MSITSSRAKLPKGVQKGSHSHIMFVSLFFQFWCANKWWKKNKNKEMFLFLILHWLCHYNDVPNVKIIIISSTILSFFQQTDSYSMNNIICHSLKQCCMDGWVRVLRPFNSISVISRRWKHEHERLCAMKRPVTLWSEVGSANHSATRTLLTMSIFGKRL